MANPENSDSPQVKLVHECHQGFGIRDLDRITKAVHRDFRQILYPKSLRRPELTREEWPEHRAEVINLCATDTEVGYIDCSSDPFRSQSSIS
jgi:hypothetical protein